MCLGESGGGGWCGGRNKSISLEGRGISSWFTESGASVFHIGFQRRSWWGQRIGAELGCPSTERRAENTRLLHVGAAWQGHCTETPLKAQRASQGCGQKKKSPQNYSQEKCASISHLDAEGGSPGLVWQGCSRKLHSCPRNTVLSSQGHLPPPGWTWSRMELPLLGWCSQQQDSRRRKSQVLSPRK